MHLYYEFKIFKCHLIYIFKKLKYTWCYKKIKTKLSN
jgi:hypothetical protein